MVNGHLTISRLVLPLGALLLFVLSAANIQPGKSLQLASAEAKVVPEADVNTPEEPPPPPEPKEPEATLPPPVDDVLKSGTLIVISKASQQMHVFKDGALWDTSPVSTGKKGHTTPSGVFPILQKKTFHRSNLYSNAPMPHMQRLTWDGIAIHAGYVPGYPASHGCIRVPSGFARSLYKITRFGATTVVVADQPVVSQAHAKALALEMPLPAPMPGDFLKQGEEPVLAHFKPSPEEEKAEELAASAKLGGGQIIQLAASPSAAGAEKHWTGLVSRHPDLGKMNKAIIPAVVGGQKVYRLRASGPSAYASCKTLQQAGAACFPVS